MLVAHHVIDVLRGVSKRPPWLEMPGVTKDTRYKTADLIEDAQKFDFGTLMFERGAEDGKFKMPALTAQEIEFWRQGYIPLPFQTCWYEFTLGKSRSGLLIEDTGAGWRTQRIDYCFDCLLYEGVHATAKFIEHEEMGGISVDVGGNDEFLSELNQLNLKRHFKDERFEDFIYGNVGVSPVLAIYMTLMLNSRTTERVKAPPPPPKVNKKREHRGKSPLADHLIVTIIPARFREESEREGEKHHSPPRLHWRRSHLRHYDHHTPASKWVPEAVHDGKQGWWIAVIPRMLVGRADLGEVSHEYRIAQPIELPEAT